MARIISIVATFLFIMSSFIPAGQVHAQDTNSLVMKLFQEFSQVNKFPLPSISWDTFASARNNNSGDLPAILTKPLTATRGLPKSTSSGQVYEGNFLYYTPGGECLRIEMYNGEAIVYGGYTLIVVIAEYTSPDGAARAVENYLNDVKESLTKEDKLQSKAIAVRQSRGYEYSVLRERTVEGSNNKKTSEFHQIRLWSQGKFFVYIDGNYEGCPTKGPDPFALSDQLYDLVSKHLSPSPVAPPIPTVTPSAARILQGKVTDGNNHALPNLFVRLVYGTNEEVTRTDENGVYKFSNLPGGAVQGYNPQKDKIHIEVMLQYLDTPPVKQRVYDPIYQLFMERVDAQTLVRVTGADITLAAGNAATTFDLDLGNASAIRSSNPPIARLKKAGLVYYHLSRALAMAVKMGPPLTMLPIDVLLDHAPLPDSPDSNAWWDGTRGTLVKPRPSINYTKAFLDRAVAEVAYVTYHEFGHHFMADTYGDFLPVATGRTPHAGYCVNRSSNDSWVEGWAVFFAGLVFKDINKVAEPWIMHRDATVKYDLETNLTAWQNERSAVAYLLWDLIDSSQTYPAKGADDDPISISLNALWDVIANGTSTQPGSNQHIYDMVDFYENLKLKGIGQQDSNQNNRTDLDDVFILHGFYEVNSSTDTSYQPGAKIGWTSHERYLKLRDQNGVDHWCEAIKPRRTDPLLPGSYINIDLKDVTPSTTLKAEVSYSPPNAWRSYSFEFTAGDVSNGRIYLLLPPPQEPATVRITGAGLTIGDKPIEIISEEFWKNVLTGTDQPVKGATLNIKQGPASWILGFVIGGVGLAVLILILGLTRFRRQTARPFALYRSAPWNPPPRSATPPVQNQQPPRWVPPPRKK